MPAVISRGGAGGKAGENATDRNAEATVHIRYLDERVTDELVLELMTQAGPVKNAYIPRDRITGKHYGYGFCEFKNELDAAYAAKVLNMTKLFGKAIRVAQSNVDRTSLDVGANLFVGNLSPEVDEKLLHDSFSAFGSIIETPYIMREPSTGVSKGYGFVKFSTFEASDTAVATMNGQYMCNRPISVQYAFKKDGEHRERHGSQAERALAASAQESSKQGAVDPFPPHTMFADGPPSAQPLPPPPLPPPYLPYQMPNHPQAYQHYNPLHSGFLGHPPTYPPAPPNVAGAPYPYNSLPPTR